MPRKMHLHVFLYQMFLEVWYLNFIVNASGHDLITCIIKSDGQDLVGILESVDGSFFTDVPQLHWCGDKNITMVE